MENSTSTLLQFYWQEIDAEDELGKKWGQLAGSMHRLRYVADELASVVGITDVNAFLEGLQCHAENYLIRAYELRERAVGLSASICAESKLARKLKSKDLAGKLKSKDKREEALKRMEIFSPRLVEPLARLLFLLEQDIELRNLHTHDTFLSLGL